MKDSVLRLLAISTITMLAFFTAIFSLNILGSQQVFSPFDHPLLNTSQFLVLQDPSIPTENEDKIIYVPYLKVTTQDDEWVTENRRLVDVLSQLQPINLALFVNTRINLGGLIKILFDLNMQERVIIFANEQKIHIELKKMAPRWLYVANPSQKMKVKVMNTFWLAPMADYSFDIYILDPKEESQLPEPIQHELKKRHKKVILKASFRSDIPQTQDFNGIWIQP